MTYSQGFIHGQIAEINIIPLADVMLVLLIIFMIASPALTQTIALTLPGLNPDSQIQTQPAEPIRLRIDASGQVFWNDNATPTAALEAMLSAEVQRDAASLARLEIDANGDSDYQVLTTVLAAARNADLEHINFVRK